MIVNFLLLFENNLGVFLGTIYMVQNDTQITPKNAEKFNCKLCNFYGKKLSDFNRHCATVKHKLAQNGTQMVQNGTRITPKNAEKFTCNCGKTYKYKQGLYRHQKNCKNLIIENNNLDNCMDQNDLKNLVVKLINDNSEMKNIIMKQQEQIGDLIPKIGNTTNNVKQKFNINLFLNEKCKDALSIEQFIEKIEISMKNLLTTRDKGSAEGISDIIIDNMNKLSLYERPMHCTDLKRETLYIKNQEEWERDNNNLLINDAIKRVENKQLKNLQLWLDEHPNWEKNNHEQEEYMKLIKNCTNTIHDNGNNERIYKKLCNEFYVSGD